MVEDSNWSENGKVVQFAAVGKDESEKSTNKY